MLTVRLGVLRDGGLSDLDAKFDQFAVNPRRSPQWERAGYSRQRSLFPCQLVRTRNICVAPCGSSTAMKRV